MADPVLARYLSNAQRPTLIFHFPPIMQLEFERKFAIMRGEFGSDNATSRQRKPHLDVTMNSHAPRSASCFDDSICQIKFTKCNYTWIASQWRDPYHSLSRGGNAIVSDRNWAIANLSFRRNVNIYSTLGCALRYAVGSNFFKRISRNLQIRGCFAITAKQIKE